MDFNKAFSAANGVIVDEENSGPFYTGGSASPVGLNLPTSTLYLQTTASGVLLWRKFNTGVNDWRQLSAQDIPFVPAPSTLVSTNVDAGLKELSSLLNAKVFGNNYQRVNTAAMIETSSSTFQDTQTLVTPSLPSGSYLLLNNTQYYKTNLNGRVEAQFLVGATPLETANIPLPDDDFWYHASFFTVTALSGVNTIKTQFRKSSGSGSVRAQNRTVLMWRVS